MVRRTSSLGFFTGRRRRRIWSRRVKMAVLAPMPRARVRIAMAVKPGVRPRVRREYLRSRQVESSDSISELFCVVSLMFRLCDRFWGEGTIHATRLQVNTLESEKGLVCRKKRRGGMGREDEPPEPRSLTI